MAIDWAATGAMLSGWATLIGAGAVFYAAKTGADTFAGWKRQKVEERRMDAAERIMTLAYRIRYAFRSVRTRGMLGNETKAAEEVLDNALPDWRDEDTQQQNRLRTAQTILNRLKGYSDDWQEIWALKPIALALFGEDVEATLHSFWTHYVSIEVAATEYAEDSGSDRDFSVALRRDLFGSNDDAVSVGVEDSIKALEQRLLPIIRADYQSQLGRG